MTFGELRRLWPVALVVGLLGATALASAHSGLTFALLDQPKEEYPSLAEITSAPTPSIPPTPEKVADAAPASLPDWLTKGAMVVLGLVLLVVVGLVLRTLLRDLVRRTRSGRRAAGGRTPTAAQTTADVVAALDAGLVELSDADTDPRRAVIACWVRLEQAAAAAGVTRHVGDTPTDLVTRLLGRESHPVSGDVLAAFAHVYREARYATRVVDERMRDEARSALARLRAELTGSVVG